MERLRLDEAFDDSPQTRSLVGVFEKDALTLKKYTHHLQMCCQRIVQAQTELTTATQALSQHLTAYEKQKFSLGSDESILCSTLKEFSKHLDEMSSTQQILATHLNDSMIYPLSKFLQADMEEISTLHEMFQMCSYEHDQAMNRFMKLRKKDGEDKLREADDDVYGMRKKYHQTALHYYSSLNSLQYKRRCSLVEPLLGMMQSYKGYLQIAQESLCKTDTTDMLSNITAGVQSVRNEMGEDTQNTVKLIDKLEQDCAQYYHPISSKDLPVTPPDNRLTQKAGYLYQRSKPALIGSAKWDRLYHFTQGGNLMSQASDVVAGSLVLDLNEDNIYAEPLEIDERRCVFHIVSPTLKKVVVLQAENERLRDEWIFTINNIVREGGYVKETPSKPPERRSSTFGRRRTSTTGQNREKEENTRSQSNSQEATSSSRRPQPDHGGGGLDLMTTPIQFDMISPSDTADGEPPRSPKEGPPKRINPFDQTPTEIVAGNIASKTALFSQSFVVRFLGSMEVQYDRGEQFVHETMRQIMAARAIRNVFKMRESHLLVTNDSFRLLDPSNNSSRSEFSLMDISFWGTHRDNNRLFAFVSRTRGVTNDGDSPRFNCHVFECDTSGEEICQAITTATQVAYKTLMETKAIEQRMNDQEKESKAVEQHNKEQEKILLLANIQELEDDGSSESEV